MKPLWEYADACRGLLVEISGDREIGITDIQSDSRRVTPGSLFMAIEGTVADGRDYISQAISNGAAAVACKNPPADITIPVINVSDDYRALGLMAELAADYPATPMTTIAITGTNGKTTTAFQLMEILKRFGRKAGLIGTVHYDLGGEIIQADRTTPTPIRLQELLVRMQHNDVEVLVMEVSSHALVQGRMGSMAFDAAIFCNQTPEHLDYHQTMEEYYQAKRILFTDHLKSDAVAVINHDDSFGQRLLNELDCRTMSFGTSEAADYCLLNFDLAITGSTAMMSDGLVATPLIGAYNLENVMGAMCAAKAIGVGETAIRDAVSEFQGVPGRLQRVPNERDINVFIDYAHTGDALEKALNSMRPLSDKRLITVFGCGGDRDKSKRSVMGAVATADADVAVITSDNPRTENPSTIIDDILEGVPEDSNFSVEPDRKAAIVRAITLANPGDTVLIAGKGHEDYQEINGEKFPFDDYQIAKQVLENLPELEACPV